MPAARRAPPSTSRIRSPRGGPRCAPSRRNTLVGQVVAKVITRKNLILRLETPRFMDQGDTATLTGIVHNYLATDKTAKVSLASPGSGAWRAPRRASVNVPKNGEAVVTWNVRASKIAQAKFLAKALTDEESDALELDMPVEPWGLQQNVAQSGSSCAATRTKSKRIAGSRRTSTPTPPRCASTWRPRLPARCCRRWISWPRIPTGALSRPCRASCPTSW